NTNEVVIFIVLNSAHKLIVYSHRVIGILILNAEDIFSVKIHIKASLLKYAGFALLNCLTPNELFDIRVVHIKNHHLSSAASFTTRLNCTSRTISAAHKAERARSCASTLAKWFIA